MIILLQEWCSSHSSASRDSSCNVTEWCSNTSRSRGADAVTTFTCGYVQPLLPQFWNCIVNTKQVQMNTIVSWLVGFYQSARWMFRWRHSIASAETLSFLLPSTVFSKIDSIAVALFANITVDTGETLINARYTVSKTKDPKIHSDILKRGPSLV